MLQEAQRTSAPSAVSVSMSTAVWMVMCREPLTRAPASGCAEPYSARIAIKPGISCSASVISLRPKSARERSATLKSDRAAPEVMPRAYVGPPLSVAGEPSLECVDRCHRSRIDACADGDIDARVVDQSYE